VRQKQKRCAVACASQGDEAEIQSPTPKRGRRRMDAAPHETATHEATGGALRKHAGAAIVLALLSVWGVSYLTAKSVAPAAAPVSAAALAAVEDRLSQVAAQQAQLEDLLNATRERLEADSARHACGSVLRDLRGA
jgi:hypothetical protein